MTSISNTKEPFTRCWIIVALFLFSVSFLEAFAGGSLSGVLTDATGAVLPEQSSS